MGLRNWTARSKGTRLSLLLSPSIDNVNVQTLEQPRLRMTSS